MFDLAVAYSAREPMKRIILVIIGLLTLAAPAWGVKPFNNYGVRLKDIAQVEGARPNQLRGLGLVVGLNGTGEQDDDSLASKLVQGVSARFGVIPNDAMRNLSDNTAAVMVFAEIPPFVKPGTKLDVHVAAIGGADSLQGGFLVQTPLRGADGKVYAVAQGPITTGSFQFRGRAARIIRGTSTTLGIIAQGAIVEAEIPVTMLRNQYLYLHLKHPDFTTAVRVADAVNAAGIYKNGNAASPSRPAAAIDAATIRVEIPDPYKDQTRLTRLITVIENTYVEPDQVARIVVNERTGTIVIGEHVRISKVAISHGGLRVAIAEAPEVSQPQPFAERGETVTVPRTALQVEEEAARTHVLPGGVTVSELANALNVLGASPRDVIAILQAIKTAGALQAELIIQ